MRDLNIPHLEVICLQRGPMTLFLLVLSLLVFFAQMVEDLGATLEGRFIAIADTVRAEIAAQVFQLIGDLLVGELGTLSDGCFMLLEPIFPHLFLAIGFGRGRGFAVIAPIVIAKV